MKKILIIGAGVAGSDVVREINNSPEMKLSVVGYIDDDLNKIGLTIEGSKVLGRSLDLYKIIKKHGVDEIIIAIPSAKGEEIRKFINIASKSKISFKIVPRVKEIIEGKAHLENIRKVNVEDILGRPVIKKDVVGLQSFFKGKTVLVTGSAGSIGSELSRQIAAYNPKKIVLVDWWENGIFNLRMEILKLFPKIKSFFVIANIQDKKKMLDVFDKFRPNYVFHAAAYKHVPLMEEYPEEAVKNNVFGTLNVAKISKMYNVERFVLISTDKAVNPINVMGATKLITEGIGKILNTSESKFIAVRFGNVLDSYGSVIPIFRRQIEEGGPVTVTDEKMTRYFMTIPEATQLILKAASIGKGGELFVLDMGKPIKIIDLAKDMIRLSGFVPNEDIKIEFIGKRKGEKIHETIFNIKEKKAINKEGKIYVSQSLGFDINKLPKFLINIEKLMIKQDRNGIRDELKRIGVLS